MKSVVAPDKLGLSADVVSMFSRFLSYLE
jgi:hypothetical protein